MKRRISVLLISWKNILLLLVLASLMQTINVSLSWMIQQKEKSIRKGNEIYYQANRFHEDILKKVLQSGTRDSSGEFYISQGMLVGSALSKIQSKNTIERDHEVALITQCSLSRLHHLIELSKIWQGPLSVAVFLLRHELEVGVDYFVKLKKCFKSVDLNVTLSIIYPSKSDPQLQFEHHDLKDTPCDHLPFLSLFNKANYEQKNTLYPNNLLRNVARKAVTSRYSLILDIDMMPSSGLHQAFVNYAKSRSFSLGEKVVWVLPAYEIQDGFEPPRNKTSLLSVKKTGKLRPFYQELCWKCQRFTDYGVWENEKVSDLSMVKSAYEVFWQDPWEPFFISDSLMPMHDERFRQYGFNRISHVCELHVAGYRFLVLDSGFVVHLGFKRQNNLHHSKDIEQERNRLLYRQFKNNLKSKYPQSSRRCY